MLLRLIVLLSFITILLSCQQSSNTSDVTELKVPIVQPQLVPDRYNVAFLIMDGVYNTELTAPYDIFQHTIFRDSIKAMNVFMVANTHTPITTFVGIRLLPNFNYLTDSLPPIDILVVPSAEHHLDSDLEDMAMIQFVQEAAAQAQFITSHCDGAFVLAKAGLLDDVVSTTFPSDIDTMRKCFLPWTSEKMYCLYMMANTSPLPEVPSLLKPRFIYANSCMARLWRDD